MENDESEDFNSVKAELFEAISHPLRIEILQALSEKEMGFAELARAVGTTSGGHLSFHLNKLRHLVRVNKWGSYELTADGKEALWSVKSLQKSTDITSTRSGQASVRHRSLVRPAVAVTIIGVVLLGGFGAYQQSEFAGQQHQLESQQKVIDLLQNGLPFSNGQSASIVIGQRNFTSYAGATSQSGLYSPTDVAFDSFGNMWVSEFSNYRVLEFRPPYTPGMKAFLVIGQKDFSSATASPTRDGLGAACCGPNALAFDSSGNLWVDDFGANRILEYQPPFSTGMNASLVIGQKDFNSWGDTSHLSPPPGPASRNRFFSPDSIAFDSQGNLWVNDAGNNRVLEFTLPFSNGMNASRVLGQSNFESNKASQRINGLSRTFGYVAVDPNGDVWVGDAQNNRIVEFKPPFSDGMNSSLIIGQQNLAINSLTSSAYGSANLVGLSALTQAETYG